MLIKFQIELFPLDNRFSLFRLWRLLQCSEFTFTSSISSMDTFCTCRSSTANILDPVFQLSISRGLAQLISAFAMDSFFIDTECLKLKSLSKKD